MNRTRDHERTAVIEAIHRHLHGGLEAGEFDRLHSALQSSAEWRADFLRAARMDAALHEEALRRESPPARKASLTRPRRWLAAGAAALLAFAGSWWLSPQQPSASPPLAQEVATLLDARDCQWSAGLRMAPDDRLGAGTVTLSTGVAVIEFDDGARLALQGPATLELNDTNSARLHAGTVSVRCEEGAEGFTLLTPSSTVIDLGTEFGVSVAGSGETAVEVLDGEVEVVGAARQSGSGSLFLTAGQMAKVTADGTAAPATNRRAHWVRDYTSKA